MIISLRLFEYPELRAQLQPADRVVVLSCNNCAKKCKGMGGRVGMAALADKLEADGVEVVWRELCGVACSVDLIRRRANEEATRPAFEQATAIIPLACEDGEEAVAHVFPDKKVLRVTKTLGCGWGSPKVGVRLVKALHGVPLEIDFPEGITIDEAAQRLELYAGAF